MNRDLKTLVIIPVPIAVTSNDEPPMPSSTAAPLIRARKHYRRQLSDVAHFAEMCEAARLLIGFAANFKISSGTWPPSTPPP